MNCQAVVPAKTIRAVEWAGLSLFRVLKEMEVQFTDRLNQEKCQLTMTIFYSGGKSPPFFLLSRSDNEWLVGEYGYEAALKASVGQETLIPPTTGWKFCNFETKTYEEDTHLTCSSIPSSSSCSVTVSLSGLSKEIQGECEGEYKDTGLRSRGRKVINSQMLSSAHLDPLPDV